MDTMADKRKPSSSSIPELVNDPKRNIEDGYENVSSDSDHEGTAVDGEATQRQRKEAAEDGTYPTPQGSPLESGELWKITNETGSYVEREAVYTNRSLSRSRSRSRSPRSRSRSRSKSNSPARWRSRSQSARGRRVRFHSPNRRRPQASTPRSSSCLMLPFTFRDATLIDSDFRRMSVKCLFCNMEQRNCAQALEHDLKSHRGRRLPCGADNCFTLAGSYGELQTHLERNHGGKSSQRLRCKFCEHMFTEPNTFAQHVLGDYRRLRRIHYEQMALQSLTIKCKNCQAEMPGKHWYTHYRGCGMTTTKNEVGKWVQAEEKFGGSRITPCK